MIKYVLQYNPEDCGPACLATIFSFYGMKVPLRELKRKFSYGKEGASLFSIVEISELYGFNANSYKGNLQELIDGIRKFELNLPLLLHVELENGDGHYLVLKKITKHGKIKVFDPSIGNRSYSQEKFNNIWTGYIVNFEKKDDWKRIKISDEKYKLFINYLVSQQKNIFKVLIASILITIISYLGALFIKFLFDNYILQNDIESFDNLLNIFSENLIFLATFLVILYFLRMLISILKGVYTSKVSKKLSISFSNLLYEKLLDVPSDFYFNFESGEINSRFQSIMELQSILLGSTFTLIIESLSSIIGGIVLFLINVKLFVIVLLMVVIYTIVVYIFIPKLKNLNKKFYSKYSNQLTIVSQTISGIDTIKVNGFRNWFIKKMSIPMYESANYKYKEEKYSSALVALITFIESVGTLSILTLGAFYIKEGILSIGTFMAFQSIMYFFIEPLKSLILLQDELQNLSVLVERLNDVYQEPSEYIKNNRKGSRLELNEFNISLSNVSFERIYKQPILKNINLTIREGEHIAIVGESGSGKSTLLKIIATLNQVNSGTYYINNYPLESFSLDYIRRQIAYVEQDPFIFSGTLAENLLFGKEYSIDENQLDTICNVCGIYNINNLGKQALNMYLIENGDNLSGGQKQKIGIARALLKKPKILLLDEATSNMDYKSERSIFEYIKTNLFDTTVICVSHNRNVIEFVDNLVVLSNQTIENIGVIDELINSDSIFNDLFI